jgi:CHAT domain-containing protein/Tfp pilus assembly protein PilF
MTRCTLMPKRLLVFAMLIATVSLVYSQELPTPAPPPAPATQTAPHVADPAVDPRPKQRNELWNEAGRLKSEEKFAEAAVVGEKMLAIERDWLGEGHREVITSIQWLAGVYQAAEELPNYKQKLGEALQWRIANQGAEHWETKLAQLTQLGIEPLTLEQWKQILDADRLNKEVARLFGAGKYVEAISIAQRVSDVTREVLGEEHPDYAASLNNLGTLYDSMAEYAHAEPLLEQALEINRKALGEESLHYATGLNNIGHLYESNGDYTRAELHYRQAVEIRKKMLGEEHPDYATSLYILGALYESMGDYANAEPLLQKALEIRKKVCGEEHPDYAECLNQLGVLHEKMADYARAEPSFRQAMEIRKKVLGEEHLDYAISLNNLGALYSSMADYPRAEPLYRQALEIRKKVLGEVHTDYAESLSNLGVLYVKMRDYARAEPLLRQALEIWKKVRGEEHPYYATNLNNLGGLYESMEDNARAEPLLRLAVEIRKKVLGEEHPDYATSLYNLGTHYESIGDYARAEPLLRQALEIRKKMLGGEHPDVAFAHSHLGWLLRSLGQESVAEIELRQAAAIFLSHLQRTFAVQTERQRLILLDHVRLGLDMWLSLASGADVAPETVYDHLLLWKGIVFVEQQRQQLLRSDPQLADKFRELGSVTRQLAAANFAVPSSETERQRREQQIEALTGQNEQIERQLAQQSALFRLQQQTIRMTATNLLAALPQGTALVDFLVYTHATPAEEGNTTLHGEKRLLAFVIRSKSSIVMIDMGPIGPLGELIDDWRKQSRYPVGLLGQDHPGVALRKLLWEPLEASLVGAETVLLSPDGPLCRFQFAALPGKTPNTFLIEERALAVIPVPQLLPQLLASTATDDNPLTVKESLLLVGAVDYGGSPGATGEDRGGEPDVTLVELERSAALPKYGFLDQTREEIDQLQESFEEQFPRRPVAVLDGELATEAAFRRQASDYRWLHLATHGFFAPARLKSALSSNSEERSLQPGEFNRATVSGFNPGLLSGIVLTGANTEPTEGEDDGILTALEVAALDLSQVDLAVLSACETGLGEEAGGEGVLGLQRAFQLAGARTVVSSLWRVPDRQTSLLMQRFYHNVWQGKMSRIEALREAQIWILRGGDEVDRAQVPPSQWAAFVLSGDWR